MIGHVKRIRLSSIASGSSPTRTGGCAPSIRRASGRAAAARRPIARPRAATRENEYWRFCLDHVREYNHSYNFFAGMSTDDIARYQRDAIVGHRPTWKMGMNGGKPTAARTRRGFGPELNGADDPLGLFRHFGAQADGEQPAPPREPRHPQCGTQGARRAGA